MKRLRGAEKAREYQIDKIVKKKLRQDQINERLALVEDAKRNRELEIENSYIEKVKEIKAKRSKA